MTFIRIMFLGAAFVVAASFPVHAREEVYRVIQVKKVTNTEDVTKDPTTYYHINVGKNNGVKPGDIFKIERLIRENIEYFLYIGETQVVESYENVCITIIYNLADTGMFPTSQYPVVMLGDYATLLTPWEEEKEEAVVEASPVVKEKVVKRINISDKVLFGLDKSSLKPEGKEILKKVAKEIRAFDGTVRVEGHTCDLGSEAYNLSLSNRRAKAVVNHLVSAEEISRDKLTAKGFGEKSLLKKGKTEAERALNRRVEFKLIKPD